jgi:hypothetical protein
MQSITKANFKCPCFLCFSDFARAPIQKEERKPPLIKSAFLDVDLRWSCLMNAMPCLPCLPRREIVDELNKSVSEEGS